MFTHKVLTIPVNGDPILGKAEGVQRSQYDEYLVISPTLVAYWNTEAKEANNNPALMRGGTVLSTTPVVRLSVPVHILLNLRGDIIITASTQGGDPMDD